MTVLFEPLQVRGMTVRNRIWLAPMCQYAVVDTDGVPTDWHLVHLASRAVGGFGLVIGEATAVCPEGRISAYDTGLWNDQQGAGWARVVAAVHACGGRIAVQLAHAGRKASLWPHLPGFLPGTVPLDEGGWTTLAPSPLAYPGYRTPRELRSDEIAEIPSAFAAAAVRADAAGFDAVEIHAAHGYLLHEFLSPLSNQREDTWGGDFDGRTRLLFKVVDAVRGVLPSPKPLLVRISATDWVGGGWDVRSSLRLVHSLRALGVDLIDVSTGGLVPATPDLYPGYQVGFARKIRREVGVMTGAVGLISEPGMASGIVDKGAADVVLIGRAALRDAYWPQHAAAALESDQRSLVPNRYRPRSPDARVPAEQAFIGAPPRC